MSQVSTATSTYTEYSVYLPNPTNLAELNKAIQTAYSEFEKTNGDDRIYDNTFTVKASETRISITWDGPSSSVGGIK